MTCKSCLHFGLCEVLSVYYDIPTGDASECDQYKNKADFVEVVRCKDCAYWDKGENECEAWEYCKLHKTTMGKYDFCSCGKRKDGAGK